MARSTRLGDGDEGETLKEEEEEEEEEALRDAAGLGAGVDYAEAHGTGTRIGDPIDRSPRACMAHRGVSSPDSGESIETKAAALGRRRL